MMAASNGEHDIARQQFGYSLQDAIPDHPPVPLVPDNAPNYTVQVLVPSRPGYIGGSGPPLMKLLPQAPYHQSRFEIIDCVEDEVGNDVYVLREKSNPGSRVRVAPVDILDWVSQRSLEAYSCIEYARFEQFDRQRQLDEARAAEDKPPRKTTGKGRRGRPKKRDESVEEDDDETPYKEVMPAKKDRALYKSRWEREQQQQQQQPSESEIDAVPSLSQPSLSQPSLSQSASSIKRKLSNYFSKESTPGETEDDFMEEMDIRQPKRLSIREHRPDSPKLHKSATVAEESPARKASTVEVQISPPSPFRKENSAKAAQQQLQPPRVSASSSAHRIVPGASKPLFPIFDSKRPVPSSAPPRSTSEIMSPERKRPALPASSRSFDK